MSFTATAQLLQLGVPERRPSMDVQRELQTDALQIWLNGLPLANTTQAAQQLLDQLRRSNRAVLDVPLRYSALEILRPPVDALIETIKARYLGAVLPLSPRNRAHAVMVHDLLEEMAYACKLILADLLPIVARSPAEQQMLLNALPQAVNYLGQLVLGKYLLHEADPPTTWGELNRLYRYAELQLEPAALAEYEGHEESAQRLATKTYLRIVLLALANPYHLMPGEADTVHQELQVWSGLCALLAPPADSRLAGKFVVDLAGNSAPCYCSADNRVAPAEARIIDLHALLAALTQQIRNITPSRDPDSGEELPVKLSERLRRDRLLRLKSAWGGRGDRKIPRSARQARVYTCIGLSACHHFIAGEIAFQPERDEVRLHRGETLSAASLSTLSLVPKDNQPWKMQDEDERLARGVHQPRVSQFDLDSPELDIWHKIHSTGGGAETDKERIDTAYDTKTLRLKNLGAGGLCLACDGQSKVQTRVGELVAYKSETDPESEWRLGTLRWLRCQANDALELGIMRIADDAVAVAVRAIAGTGAGGEYFRALIANNGTDPVVETLIVPAAMYDIGSVLVLNSGMDLRYVCLTQVIATSTSFSQFGFTVALPPDSELEKIASIKSVRL
jgi:cyclic-di-GMP-binding protein